MTVTKVSFGYLSKFLLLYFFIISFSPSAVKETLWLCHPYLSIACSYRSCFNFVTSFLSKCEGILISMNILYCSWFISIKCYIVDCYFINIVSFIYSLKKKNMYELINKQGDQNKALEYAAF